MRPGVSSTTLTFTPSDSYTVAISRPMMPPPMTSRRFMLGGSSSAPVESMMRGSSGKPGSFTGFRARRDDALVERDAFALPSSPFTSTTFGADELAVTGDDVDLALLGQHLQAAGELLDDARLPVAQLVEVDGGLAEGRRRAPPSELASSMTFAACSRAFDGMQPTLRHTPPRLCPALDEGDLQAEVGGAERGGVAAGAGAQDEELSLAVGAFDFAGVAGWVLAGGALPPEGL